MPPFWRTFLFLFFAVCFLISAPLVVLYTAGYRYQFSSGAIVKSGVLSINTFPKGASIYLNEKLSDKRTPAVLDTLLPGKTTIRLEKDGYTSWSKTLPIMSGLSTFIPTATLFLTGDPITLSGDNEVITAAFHPTRRLAYIQKEAAKRLVRVIDLATEQQTTLSELPATWTDDAHIEWSPDGDFLLITAPNNLTPLLIRLSDRQTIPLPDTRVQNVHFDPHSHHVILYTTGAALRVFGIDTDLTTQTPLPAETQQADATRKNGSWYVVQTTTRSTVSKLDQNGIASVLTYLPLGNYQFLAAPGDYLLLRESSRGYLVLIDPNKQNRLLLNEQATQFTWSPKNDRLAFSNGFDINVYTLATEQTETITRFSDPITALAWYPIGDELLYAKNNTLFATELDRRDVRNETPLITDLNIMSLWTDKDGTNSYLLGSKTNSAAMLFKRILQK